MSFLLTDLDFAAESDVGCHRSVNQDAFYLSPYGDLFVVADGMGGHAGGQEASRLATEAIQRFWEEARNGPLETETLLKKAIEAANEAVITDQGQHPERSDMGTTLVVVAYREQRFWYSHIGDSRLYWLRDRELIQLTQDHTWVAQAVQVGMLSAEQVQYHPWRHVLSQCIGRADLSEVAVRPLDLALGSQLLLCSDGLTEEMSETDILRILQDAQTCHDAVNALVGKAKAKGGRDNITAIVVAWKAKGSDTVVNG